MLERRDAADGWVLTPLARRIVALGFLMGIGVGQVRLIYEVAQKELPEVLSAGWTVALATVAAGMLVGVAGHAMRWLSPKRGRISRRHS